jgi:biotin carboxyl carrier protein
VHVVKPLGSVVPAPAAVISAAAPSEEAAAVDAAAAPEPIRLWAPMVGVFYHAEPPLPFGAEIKPGQVVGCIESMKLMNDVRAEQAGSLTDILIEDGAPVEYGQTLFRLAAFPPN